MLILSLFLQLDILGQCIGKSGQVRHVLKAILCGNIYELGCFAGYYSSGLEVIKLEYSLRLKKKTAIIGCLQTRVCKQPIIALYFFKKGGQVCHVLTR